MGLSTNSYTYTGGDTVFPVNFALGFLDRCHVTVEVNGTERDFTWIDDSNIDVPNVRVGDGVTVLRTVPHTQLEVNFEGADDVTNRHLDLQTLQPIMLYHEIADGRFTGLEAINQWLAACGSDNPDLRLRPSLCDITPDMADNVTTVSDLRLRPNICEI